MKFIYIIVMASLILFAGCDVAKMETSENVNVEGLISARLSVSRGDTTESFNTVSVYRFYLGVLDEVFTGMYVCEDGTIKIKPSSMRGNVYFMVNADRLLSRFGFEKGITSEEEFLSMKASTEELTEGGMMMTGMSAITQQTSTVDIGLKRALARIDISSPMNGVEVKSVKLKNVCTSGYVMNGWSGDKTTVEKTDLVRDFGMNPLLEAEETLFYLPQQEGSGYEVEIMVTSSGAWHRLKTVLPEILRNRIYTLKVYSDGASFRVEVIEGNWLEGGGSVSEGIYNSLVDIDKSSLEDGVIVSEGRDTVFIPSWETNCSIVISGEAGVAACINGNISGANVTLSELSTDDGIFSVEVASKHKMPGTKDEYLYVDMYNAGILRGRVVMVFKANPVYISGLVEIDEEGVCDFNKYVDGELAEIYLPEDKEISLSFDEDTPEWMKLETTEKGTIRLLGGWRPNDPEADGRVQEGRILITENGGIHSEVYVIKRKNWGLPVENINGTWWCKYNLRGNVKSFTDQILVGTDPVNGGSVAEYLQRCTDDEFLEVLGGQYQAGNQNELKMVYGETGFMYEGYSQKSENFGTLDPKYMAPDGYEIPDYDDYRFFNWGGNTNLGYYNPGVFNNGLGQRLNFTVVERNATFLGHVYGPVTFYDFEYQGQHLTLCGLGHQWDDTNIAKMSILFATYGNSGSTWGIEGYSKAEGKGNWFKFYANNNTKTRTIRCIKTPVEYIY